VKVFDELAKEYDLWYERPFGRSVFLLELRCLRETVGSFRRGLEIGVGTGRFASALGIKFGVDPSLEMLRIARERGVIGVQGVGESLPFKEGSFDLVLSVLSLCFVRYPIRVLREARRVLVPEGRLILGLLLRESPWAEFYIEKARKGHPIYREANFHSFLEVKGMLEEAGFQIKGIRSTLLEEPQDREPIRSHRIVEGYVPEAGFTCLLSV